MFFSIVPHKRGPPVGGVCFMFFSSYLAGATLWIEFTYLHPVGKNKPICAGDYGCRRSEALSCGERGIDNLQRLIADMGYDTTVAGLID